MTAPNEVTVVLTLMEQDQSVTVRTTTYYREPGHWTDGNPQEILEEATRRARRAVGWDEPENDQAEARRARIRHVLEQAMRPTASQADQLAFQATYERIIEAVEG